MDVIAFGSTFLELVFGQLDHLPAPGEEIYSDEFAISCGGAVSIASAGRELGVVTAIATILGEDLGSRVLEQHCERMGIDTSPSQRVTGRSAGISVVLNYGGDRAFVSHMPHGRFDQGNEIEDWIVVLRRERPRWAYLHAGPGVEDFLRVAREVGTSVALDVSFGAIEHFRDEVLGCVALADVFVPNDHELRRLTRTETLEGALQVASSWGTTVVAKCGAGGAIVLERGRQVLVAEGLLDIEVRDRTGAGDAFAGAMIAALVQGATLLEAARAGNRAGSLAVARLGAVGEVEVAGLSVAAEAVGACWEESIVGK